MFRLDLGAFEHDDGDPENHWGGLWYLLWGRVSLHSRTLFPSSRAMRLDAGLSSALGSPPRSWSSYKMKTRRAWPGPPILIIATEGATVCWWPYYMQKTTLHCGGPEVPPRSLATRRSESMNWKSESMNMKNTHGVSVSKGMVNTYCFRKMATMPLIKSTISMQRIHQAISHIFKARSHPQRMTERAFTPKPFHHQLLPLKTKPCLI